MAAAKLREALREKAGTAQYIETVRGRGYRFNGPVEALFDAPRATATHLVVSRSAPAPAAVSPAIPDEVRPPATAGFLTVLRRYRFAAIAFLLLLAVAAGAYFHHRKSHSRLIGISGQVVLGGFINDSGDKSYDGLEHAIRLKLEQSPYLHLLPEQSLLRLVSNPDAAPLQQLLKGCSSIGGKVLITGKISDAAPGYKITTAARDCTTGALLADEAIRVGQRDAVLGALDQATDRLRSRLGESSASLQRFDVPLAQATTSSLAALRAFTLGEEKRDKDQEFAAIQDYKLAVDLDPQFALAYARLGTIYSNAAELTKSAEYYQKAFDLREHTTDRERLYIAAHYYSISGQIPRTIEAYELWRSLYPRDSSPYQNLAIQYLELGQPGKAAGNARMAVQLDAASSLSEATLGRVYLETGQQAQLHNLCREVQGKQNDSAMLHESCFLLAFLEKDETAMEEQVRWARGNDAESELLDDVAWVAMYEGKLGLGRKLFAQARQTALAQGFSELAATVESDEAILEAEFGYEREAHALSSDALRLAPENESIQALAALALARSGDIKLAALTAEKILAHAPLDTILNDAELPAIRAAIELRKHAPKLALAALEPARPYDACSALALAPAYYRGIAYQDGGRPKEAAAEFRAVLAHRALVPDSPYIPLAALRLSRVLEATGDSAGKREAEMDLKAAWQHADPGFLPLLRR